jgi:hypothetical protein
LVFSFRSCPVSPDGVTINQELAPHVPDRATVISIRKIS